MRNIKSIILCLIPMMLFSFTVKAQKFYYDTVVLAEDVKVITYDKQYTRDLTQAEINARESVKCMVPIYVNIDTIPIDMKFDEVLDCEENLSQYTQYLMFVNASVKNDTLYVSEILTGSELFKGAIEDNYMKIDLYSYRLVIEEQGFVDEQYFRSYYPIQYDTMLHNLDGPGDTLEVFHYRVLSSVNVPPGGQIPPPTSIQELNNSEVNVYFDMKEETLKSKLPANGKLSLFDLNGKLLFEENLNKGWNNSQVGNVNASIYIVRIAFDGQLPPVEKLLFFK